MSRWQGHCLGCTSELECETALRCLAVISRKDIAKMATAQQTIEDREVTHGDYRAQANLAASIKELLRDAKGWKKLDVTQTESLDMIAVKISRILHGDPNAVDHWTDIAGYATLISNLLSKGTHL